MGCNEKLGHADRVSVARIWFYEGGSGKKLEGVEAEVAGCAASGRASE